MKRFQIDAYADIAKKIDRKAMHGLCVRLALGDHPVFDARPETHDGATGAILKKLYRRLRTRARRAGRLADGEPLCKRWRLDYDIYSPKLNRFIEIDEKQHFSSPRLDMLAKPTADIPAPLYPPHFESIRSSLTPQRFTPRPHRDEQRAYLDAARELLPPIYGFARTLRIDEFSIDASGGDVAGLVRELVKRDPS